MKRTWKKVLFLLLRLSVTLLVISPFYITIIYSVKSKQEMVSNRLAFPKVIHWDNFTRARFYNTIYYIFVGAMIIPFQSIMTPLYISMSKWKLLNSIPAFVAICNCGIKDSDPARHFMSSFYPAEIIVARGYACAAFRTQEVAPDYDEGFTTDFTDCSRNIRRIARLMRGEHLWFEHGQQVV